MAANRFGESSSSPPRSRLITGMSHELHPLLTMRTGATPVANPDRDVGHFVADNFS